MPRRQLCASCGVNQATIHSFCEDCHTIDIGPDIEYGAAIGKDRTTRCDESECWACDSIKWKRKRTRPPKECRKDIVMKMKKKL